MQSVQDVLTDDYGLGSSLTGWTLTTASAVSADGTTIVGYGSNADGDTEAWMARLDSPGTVVPEPGSITLLGIGAVILGMRWLQRRKHTLATH